MATAKGPGSMATSRQKTVGHPAAGGKLWRHQSLNSRRHSAGGSWTLAVLAKIIFECREVWSRTEAVFKDFLIPRKIIIARRRGSGKIPVNLTKEKL
jgi:hypothetical protein